MKNIVIEISGGLIQAVYCPDETYSIHILDRDDQNVGDEVREYYRDVEEEINNLKKCL
jgi:hypothetical protein